MSLALRIVLVLGAVGLLAFVLFNIRKSKLRIEDSLFWFILSALILVIAVFPGVVSACSRLLKFQAPVNFVFLAFITVLLVKCFTMSIRISHLETKLGELTQKVAISNKEGDSGDGLDDGEAGSADGSGKDAVHGELR